jgi:hypothetical protein
LPGRDTTDDRSFCDRARDDGVSTDDGVPTDRHSLEYDCVLSDPGKRADPHRRDTNQWRSDPVAIGFAETVVVVTDGHIRTEENIVFDLDEKG